MSRPIASAWCLAAALAFTLFRQMPAEARIVFDPQNYAQNLLQAARALEQIHNQIASLQNEARMLENMARELAPLDYSSLEALTQSLRGIEDLIREAEGISFEASQTKAVLDRYYDTGANHDAKAAQLMEDAETRWTQALAAYRTALTFQSELVGGISQDQETVSVLVTQSQSAVGSLQAEQAGNQLLALAAKQQLQIQTLLVGQFRAEALEAARKAKREEAARATTQDFLGAGSAYTPH